MSSGKPQPLYPGLQRQQQGYLTDPASYFAFLENILGGGGKSMTGGRAATGNPFLDRIFGGQQPGASFKGGPGFLGVQPTDLQRQGSDAIGTMLGQVTPEQRALDIALPQLQEMLTGTGPQFERDLSLANQQGGRFGSANAILRGEAVRNLYNLRNQTADTMRMLSGSAGQANRGQAQQAFDVGTAQAQQGDIGLQRQLQILMQLLGVGQQAAFQTYQPQNPLQGAAGFAGGAFLGPLLGGMGGNIAKGMFGP